MSASSLKQSELAGYNVKDGLNGLGKDAAKIISRINGFTLVETKFDYFTGKVEIVKETKYGNIGLSSLDTPITSADSDDKAMTLGDTIADTQPNTSPFDQLDEKDIRAKLGAFLKKLSDKEATAIKLRFSSKPDGSQRTFAEIGKELGLTSMGAKLLVDRTLTKLKEFAKEENVN